MSLITKHTSWHFLHRDLISQFASLRAASKEVVEAAMWVPLGIAWWIQQFAPEMANRESLNLLVSPKGPADTMDGGRWLHYIPALLGNPKMHLQVTVATCRFTNPTRPNGLAARTSAAAFESATRTREHAAVSGNAAPTILTSELAQAARAAQPDLVVLMCPDFLNEGPEWIESGRLAELVASGAAIAAFSYSRVQYAFDRACLAAAGVGAADQVLANPWADHTKFASVAGWAWNLTNLRVPHAATSPFKLADQLGELEYWALQKYGKEDADKHVAALGQAFDAVVGGAPRRFARLPDYTAVALDTGELFALAQDGSLPRPRGDSALPAEIVEAYPSEGDLAAKALWAYNAQYKKERKSAGAPAARLEEFDASFPAPLVNVFRTWLHTGWIDLDTAMGADSASPPVFKTFGQFVAAHAQQTPAWELTPIADFLAQPAAQRGTVRDVLRDWLTTTAEWLLDTALELAEVKTLTKAQSVRDACMAKLVAGGREQLADMLLATVESEMKGLCLVDAFRRRRHHVEFASWAYRNSRLLLEAQPVSADNSDKPLFLYLDDGDDEDDSPVEAREWVGGLKDPDLIRWRTVAAGMLYSFVRRARNRGEDLAAAADNSSSGDLDRVEAFLESHDHETILSEGDIAFVWQWERRHDTPAGEGIECLAAICEQLRAEAPNLRSIVFALSPERLVPRSEGEPPVIAEMRLADLDQLQTYVSSLAARLGLDVYLTASDQSDVSREADVVSP